MDRHFVGSRVDGYPPNMLEQLSTLENAVRAGIDLGLTNDNLRLSYDQRALQHQAALDLALEIERAGQ